MPDADQTLRIFISSPGDVGQERVIAERVVERLQGEFGGRAHLDPVLWEHQPLRATEHFQEQITPPAQADIALFILWSRLGTPLPEDKFQKEDGGRYRSGTEWEFENAVKGYRKTGSPDLLTYRKTKDPETRLDDTEKLQERIAQKEALEDFIDEWFRGEESFKAAFHTFEGPAEFERMLEQHLRTLVEEHLPDRPTESGAMSPVSEVRWHQGSPFRGLRAFEHDHAPVFFGRTEEVGSVIEALQQQAESGAPFVLVHGPSGSGKSSVVRAGVVPTITQPGVVQDIGLWRWGAMQPADTPSDLLRGLATALLGENGVPRLEAFGFGMEGLTDLLRDAPARAANPLQRALEAEAEDLADSHGLPSPPTARFLLVLDQLEEVFTLDAVTDADRAAFAEAVHALTESGLVWTVATMRSDFFPRCAELEALRPLKRGAGQYDLDPPTFSALGWMIRGPVQAAGLRFERDPERGYGLDEVLHDAAAEAPEALPLLEFTLEELYCRRTDDGVLTFDAYEALGGLEGAIAQRAESVYQELDAQAQAAFPDVMRALITIESGEGEAVTSRRVAKARVADTPAREALVDALVDARLLVTTRTDDGTAAVNVAHEALLREWPRLRELIERDRDLLQTRAWVAESAARWEDQGRPDDLLLPKGQSLGEARSLLRERRVTLGEALKTYIEASIDRAEAEQTRRRRLRVGGTAALVVLISAFGLFSYWQWSKAAQQRDRVLRTQARNRAEEAQAQVEAGRPMRAMETALSVLPTTVADPDRPYVADAQRALYQALMHTPQHAYFDAHEGPITDAALGPEGRYLITASRDSTARLYDLRARTVTAVLEGHDGPVTQVAIDAEANRALTVSGSTARIWSMPGGASVGAALEHDQPLVAAHLSPDGTTVWAGHRSRDEVAWTLWDVEGNRLWSERTGGEIAASGFGPEGRHVYAVANRTATQAPQLHLWASDGSQHRTAPVSGQGLSPSEVEYGVTDAALGAEGQMLSVMAGGVPRAEGPPTAVAYRYQLPGLTQTRAVRRSDVYARRARLGPTGRHAAFPGRTLSIVDLAAGTDTAAVQVEGVGGEAFLRSGIVPGKRAVVGTPNERVLHVSLTDGRTLDTYSAHTGEAVLTRLHPRRQQIVSVGREGVQVWSTARQPGARRLGATGATQGRRTRWATLGAEGKRLAYTDADGHPHLVSLKGPRRHKALEGHQAQVLDLDLDPSGQTVATAAADGQVRLWNAQDGTSTAVLRHDAPATWVAFARGGDRLIVATDSSGEVGRTRRGSGLRPTGTVHVWSLEGPSRVAEVERVDVRALRVAPGGRRLLVRRQAAQGPLLEVRSTDDGAVRHHFGREGAPPRVVGGRGLGGGRRDGGMGPNGRFGLAVTEEGHDLLDVSEGRRVPVDSGTVVNQFYGFSPDGAALALASLSWGQGAEKGASLPVYETATGRVLYRLTPPDTLTDPALERTVSVAFSPRGGRLVSIALTADERALPVLWRVQNGARPDVAATLPPVQGGLRMEYGPNGRHVFATEIEGTAVPVHVGREDHPAAVGASVMRLEGHRGGATALFTPEGQHILTRSDRTGRLRAWPVFEGPQALIDSARAHLRHARPPRDE